ncbi:MAG: RNA methyltransferase [Clostridia bacterium]|nr:RNA methyltransferase [Clostridia bacterium]
MLISSRENKLVKYVKKLNKRSFRDETGQFLAEGERLVRDLSEKGAQIDLLFMLSGCDFGISAKESFEVTENVLSAMADTENPQGVLAVVKKPEYTVSDISDPVVICDRVSDPGNLGTIIRTADSAGFGAVVLLPGCADVYSPKAVRSTMGSLYGIPIVKCGIDDVKKKGLEIVCADLHKSSCIYDYDLKKPFAVVIGNEANGVSDEIRNICDGRIKIPMLGSSESLNAAVSFAVTAYEAVRQRRAYLLSSENK